MKINDKVIFMCNQGEYSPAFTDRLKRNVLDQLGLNKGVKNKV
ncbi:hypothetical protein [Heyndrickxia vini]|nr:hypothetical protein [Heyndrickxia vini]